MNSKLPNNLNDPTNLTNLKGKRIHAVGIKGTGLCALIEILSKSGAIITGSDVPEIFYTDSVLKTLGIKPLLFSPDNITSDIDLVIHSAAYRDNHAEIKKARALGIPAMLYTEALGKYSTGHFSIGVCGVHGKTSTTGLIGTILQNLPIPFQVLAGSVINSFTQFNKKTQTAVSPVNKNSSAFNDINNTKTPRPATCKEIIPKHCTYTSNNFNPDDKNCLFIAETCEYQRHFMKFHPKAILLTAVESDHEDYYPTFPDIQNAFVDYICLLPNGGLCVYCKSDEGAASTIEIAKKRRPDINFISYGSEDDCDYTLKYIGVTAEHNNFKVNDVPFALIVPGKHEVMDAAGAIATINEVIKYYLADSFKKCTQIKSILEDANNANLVRQALLNFTGGARRSEIVGRVNIAGNDVLVVDDYGHHPTAIKTTLSGFKDFWCGRKIIVDFMSHTYSRTAALLSEFATSFTAADVVILHKIYSSARENPLDFKITGRTLFDEVKKYNNEVFYTDEILDALDLVTAQLSKPLDNIKYPNGYLFITMGAGDNFTLGQAILKLQK